MLGIDNNRLKYGLEKLGLNALVIPKDVILSTT